MMNSVVLGKKILIVSSWAPPMVGGAMALHDLLSVFDSRSYCILTSYMNIRGHLNSFRGAGSWLSCKYFFYDYPSKVDKPVAKKNFLSIDRTPKSWRRNVLRPTHGLVTRAVFSHLRIMPLLIRMILTGVRVVRSENIDYILGVSDTGPALLASHFISRLTGRPYALYLFDIYLGNHLPFMSKIAATMFEALLIGQASVVIVTNETMDQLYRQRYGDRFKSAIIHNSIISNTYRGKRTPYKPVPPYSIVFTGLVYWAQERSLANLIAAIDRASDLPIRLDLYVPNADKKLRQIIKKHKNMHILFADRDEMPTVQSNATILFLPLSWHTQSPEVIATASPAKLTDYLASGRPILVHAPPNTFVNQYARENNFALVVDEEDVEKLADGIRTLISNVRFSRKLVRNALRVFHRNHDAVANARKIAEILNEGD